MLLGLALLSGCATAPSDVSAPVPPAPAEDAFASAPDEETSRDGRLDVTLVASEEQVPYAGTTRWSMTYNGMSPGPTLRVHPGDTLSITIVNELDRPTSLHTHGLHVSPDQDNPFVMVEPGTSRTYRYDIPPTHEAGTFWYHPHVHGLTAEQVSSGLFGALIIEDATDDTLDEVTNDHIVVINDPPLVTANPWGSDGGMGGMGGMDMGGSSGVDMMTAMVGRTGPRLLANGQAVARWPDAEGRLERARVINATASSRLRLTFTGDQMLRLASEGGRLTSPQEVTAIDLAPGERTELVLIPGSSGGELLAQRLSNEGGGRPARVESVAILGAHAATDASALPTALSPAVRDLFAPDVPVARQRVITLDGHMNPTIDGTPFDPTRVNFTATKGTVEEWVIRNNSPMVHPIHLHTWPFQVQGEEGSQDVVTVEPRSQQVIRVAFDDFAGTTVLHCHILDHEDNGMMAVIQVT